MWHGRPTDQLVHNKLKPPRVWPYSLDGLSVRWGTEIIASSSTFRPNPGRVIRELWRQLHAVRHGTEALVYSNHPREAAYLAI